MARTTPGKRTEVLLMKITRIYADREGESWFEDLDVACSPKGFGFISNPMEVEQFFLRETAARATQDWHQAPRKQYVVLLSGAVEVEVSSGEVRRFETGDVLLAEDTHGKGHRTTSLSDEVRKSLFITVREAA